MVKKVVAGEEKAVARAEVLALARELAAARAKRVRAFQQVYEINVKEADERVQDRLEDPLPQDLEERFDQAPEQITWGDLDWVAERDPERALAVWNKIKAQARAELERGITASKAVEGYTRYPWKLAQFLAIRDGMIEEWQPKGGLEMRLIDILAQTYWCYLSWVEELTIVTSTQIEAQKYELEKNGRRRPTKRYIEQEEEKAAAMVDRLNRIFMRTLRGLRDLRRYGGQIRIESPGQVNIGDKQINVSSQK